MSASAQTKKADKSATPPGGAVAPQAGQSAPPPVSPKVETVEVKDTIDSAKLDRATARQQLIRTQAEDLQQKALQSIEPQLAPLKNEFVAEGKIVAEERDKVKKENDFGSDVTFDENLNSPTFGKWVKTKKADAQK